MSDLDTVNTVDCIEDEATQISTPTITTSYQSVDTLNDNNINDECKVQSIGLDTKQSINKLVHGYGRNILYDKHEDVVKLIIFYYSTENNEIGLNPLFLSKIEEIVKEENVINTIKKCFMEHKIKHSYFQNHKRKDLWILLRKYKITLSISTKLWRAFTDKWELKKNKGFIAEADNDEFKVHSIGLGFANKYGSVELLDNNYDEHKGAGFDDNTENKETEQHDTSIIDQLDDNTTTDNNTSIHYTFDVRTLVGGYTGFHGKYKDIVKLITFKYACIKILSLTKLSLNQINWSKIKIIKSQSTNTDLLHGSFVIPQKAMREFCCVALERCSNNENNSLISIAEKEWLLIVQVMSDCEYCDVGVSFRYNDKSQNLFVATAIYLDKEEIVSKHELSELKPFILREIKFIDDHIDDHNDDMDQDDDIVDFKTELELQSDWEEDMPDNDNAAANVVSIDDEVDATLQIN